MLPTDSKWVLDEIEGESTTLSLETVDFEITLSDLYEKVDFAQGGEE